MSELTIEEIVRDFRHFRPDYLFIFRRDTFRARERTILEKFYCDQYHLVEFHEEELIPQHHQIIHTIKVALFLESRLRHSKLRTSALPMAITQLSEKVIQFDSDGIRYHKDRTGLVDHRTKPHQIVQVFNTELNIIQKGSMINI